MMWHTAALCALSFLAGFLLSEAMYWGEEKAKDIVRRRFERQPCEHFEGEP